MSNARDNADKLLDVELDVPVEYGGLNFNGTSSYLDTNALTGITDTKTGSLVMKVRFANAAGANAEYLFHATGAAFQLLRAASSGTLSFGAENAGGTIIMAQNASNACAAAGVYTILASWDLAVAGSMKLWLNDTDRILTSVAFTNDTIDYTVTEWSMGAHTTVPTSTYLNGDIYAAWFDETVALDFDDATVRRKFFDADGAMNFLGANGEIPTGTAPILFHGYDGFDEWIYQRGRASTAWTRNGTQAAAGVATTGVDADLTRYVEVAQAAHTVGRTVASLTANRAAGTVTLTLPAAGSSFGREIMVRTVQAQTVVSAASDVVPVAGGAAGTAILAATAGKWAMLKSNGVNWQTVMAG